MLPAVVSIAALCLAAPAEATREDVIPILLRHCTTCHGPREQQGGLDLRTRESMLRGGKSGPAIVPGKPEASLILKRIRAGEMPPRESLVAASVKPVESNEAEIVARWIEIGAPEGSARPDVASGEPDPLVSDKERSFWAFRGPTSRPVPATRPADRARNPIDAWVLDKLAGQGLGFTQECDPAALLRRLHLDLTGLPPEPEEVVRFLADSREDAYERVVDRLLASQHFGERWGQAWLDAAGYADSDGKREQDLPRLFAWRYRDYVIRSFNADKPYDRFLTEQIAGDELEDYEHAPEITREIEDHLVATGFLRMAPDPTWASITNFVEDRIDIVADEIDIFSTAVLGLTVKCARCHDHKIDPVPQRDYYRLADVFKGAYDEHDWLRSGWYPGISTGKRADRELPYVSSEELRSWQAREEAISQEIALLQGSLTALASSGGKEVDAIRSKIGNLEGRRAPRPTIRALWDRGEPSPTFVLRRGDPRNPGRLVGPGVPSVLTDGKTPFRVEAPWPGARSTGRRLALARWLSSPENPLVARVIVNRMWRHHFGRGIVRTLGDFGKAGAWPTHPELLDWLALELIRSGWSLKTLHRLMVTSTVYRQGSQAAPEALERDPENDLFSRAPLRRLDAEQVFDSLLFAAGCLDSTPFGPPSPLVPLSGGRIAPAGSPQGWRRAIYTAHERKRAATLLESFDQPQMNPSCIERKESTVVLQALELLNDGFVLDLARTFASRLQREAGSDGRARVERLYLVALGREPAEGEAAATLEALKALEASWGGASSSADSDAEAKARALASVCHVVFNSAEFLHVD